MGRHRSGAGGAALVVAAVTLALAGCTAADASDGAAQEGDAVAPWGDSTTQFLTAVPLGDDGLFIMRPPPPRHTGLSGSGSALVSGELGTLPGGCFGLLPDTVVVWPAGTTALPDGSGVRLAGGEELRQGDSLETGGSYGDVQFSGPASACPTTGVAHVGAPSS